MLGVAQRLRGRLAWAGRRRLRPQRVHGRLAPRGRRVLHTSRALSTAWEESPADPALAARWAALEDLPQGTLGRRITEFYRARGFAYPGCPARHRRCSPSTTGSTSSPTTAPPSSPSSRSSRSSPGPTTTCGRSRCWPWSSPSSRPGYLRTGAGLFEYSPGHLSRVGHGRPGGRRPAPGRPVPREHRLPAHRLVRAGRPAGGRGPPARSASPRSRRRPWPPGSVGPWEPGGISPFQVEAGGRRPRRPVRPTTPTARPQRSTRPGRDRSRRPDQPSAIPITGRLSVMLPVEPWKVALPKAKTPPSEATR